MNKVVAYVCIAVVIVAQAGAPLVVSAQNSSGYSVTDSVLDVVAVDDNKEIAQSDVSDELPRVEVSDGGSPDMTREPIDKTVMAQQVSPVVVATETQPPVPLSSGDVLISKIQIGDVASTKNEFVELYNQSEHAVSLAGWRLDFLTEKHDGNSVPTRILKTFTTEVMQPGDYYIIGHSGFLATPIADAVFDVNVSSGSLPLNGTVRLSDSSAAVVDMVGWGNAAQYAGSSPIPTSSTYSIDRCMSQLGVMVNTDNNESDFQVYEYDRPLFRVSPMCQVAPEPEVSTNFCPGIVITEIHANTAADQFVELHNQSNLSVDMTGCMLQTNRSATSRHVFADHIVHSGEYVVVYIKDTPLTLTKTTTGTVYLLSSDAAHEIDTQTYANLTVDKSWSRFDDGWSQTYSVTPGEPNRALPYLSCSDGYYRSDTTGRCNKIVEVTATTDCGDGKYRSEETGRCRQIPTASVLAACKLGQYRSEETNRCRNVVSASTPKPCRDDQYRSEETNRCRNLVTAASQLTPCKENQERNPETNRCRNVTKTVPAAAFAVTPVADSAKVFVGWWVLGGIVLFALGYAGWEWRHEVKRFVRSVLSFSLRRR